MITRMATKLGMAAGLCLLVPLSSLHAAEEGPALPDNDPPPLSGVFEGEALSPLQEMQVREIVRSYIEGNAHYLYESMQRGYRMERAFSQAGMGSQAAAEEVSDLANYDLDESTLADILSNPLDPLDGASDPEAPVVVEFFDYACIHCKTFKPTITFFLRENTHVRHIYKALPIMGPESMHASLVGLYLAQESIQDYQRYHYALMQNRGMPDREVVEGLLLELGYDARQAYQEIDDRGLRRHLESNLDIASSKLGIVGTPAILVNGTLFKRPPTKEEMGLALTD